MFKRHQITLCKPLSSQRFSAASSVLLIDILAAKIPAINAMVKPELQQHPVSTFWAVWWLPKQLTQKFIQHTGWAHSASHQNSFSQIHCQTHAWFPYNYKSRSCLLLYCISPEMCQAEVAHNELKWRHVCGVSGPLRGQGHLLEKTIKELSINTSTTQRQVRFNLTFVSWRTIRSVTYRESSINNWAHCWHRSSNVKHQDNAFLKRTACRHAFNWRIRLISKR